MTTFTKAWGNGDLLTLETGAGGFAVSSAPNMTDFDREMSITVSTINTTGAKAQQAVLVKQRKTNNPALGYWVHAVTDVKTWFSASGTFNKPSWALSAKEVKLPTAVTSLGNNAFENCTSLQTFIAQTGLKTIGEYAFSGCSALRYVTLPAGVTSIGYDAFMSCIGLESITIPNSVTSIAYGAFSWCKALVSFTIPSNVSSVGGYAFYECLKLTSIVCMRTTPPTIADTTFSGLPLLASIKVPAASVNAYKAATNWISHAAKISAI